VLECHGAPDVLINSAGAGRWLSVLETSRADALQMMVVPYLGAFNLTHEFLPAMLARGSGRIVNVTSVAARLAWPGAAAYIARGEPWRGSTRGLSTRQFCATEPTAPGSIANATVRAETWAQRC
jgi:NADP-dependent 3-hydroxy acid dehydrogenase YdfG